MNAMKVWQFWHSHGKYCGGRKALVVSNSLSAAAAVFAAEYGDADIYEAKCHGDAIVDSTAYETTKGATKHG